MLQITMLQKGFNRHFVSLLIPIVFMLAAIPACTSAPVQEMSDARQAILVAKRVGLNEYALLNIKQAEQHLQKAKHALDNGEYKKARENANTAKHLALEAQKQATTTTMAY